MDNDERAEHQARHDAMIALWADEHWQDFEARLAQLAPDERRAWVRRVANGIAWLVRNEREGRR